MSKREHAQGCAPGNIGSPAGDGGIGSNWNNRDVDVGSGLLRYREENQKRKKMLQGDIVS